MLERSADAGSRPHVTAVSIHTLVKYNVVMASGRAGRYDAKQQFYITNAKYGYSPGMLLKQTDSCFNRGHVKIDSFNV